MFEEGSQVYYYNQKLYFVTIDITTNEYWLYESNLDGTEQNRLCYLFTQGEGGITYSVVLHRGYAYYEVSNYSTLDTSDRELYRVELKKNATKELVDTTQGYGAGFMRIQGYGEYIYYEKFRFTDEQATSMSIGLYQYNTVTKEVKEISPGLLYDYYIEDNDVYYSDNQGVHRLTIDSNEVATLINRDYSKGVYNMYFDGEYIYLDNLIEIQPSLGEKEDSERTILIYDKQGTLINTLEVGNLNEFLAGDEKYLFIMNTREYPEGTNAIVSLLDKSKLSSNEVEWIHVEGE